MNEEPRRKAGSWFRAVAGGFVASAGLAVSALAMPRLVHRGDVRYALAVGSAAAWVGWPALYGAAFLALFSAALVGAGLVITRHAAMATRVPQGHFW